MTSIRALGGASAIWSVEVVEEALIGAHELWRRSPGERHWPFAGDGPWHLAQGEVGDVAGEYSETILTTDAGRELRVRKVDSVAPRCPLDAAEVGERDRVTAWLQWVADPLDRRLVWLATAKLAAGESRVPWGKLAVRLGRPTAPLHEAGGARPLTRQALLRRYRLALAVVACRLNGWPLRRAKAMLARDGLVEEPAGERPAFVVVGEG